MANEIINIENLTRYHNKIKAELNKKSTATNLINAEGEKSIKQNVAGNEANGIYSVAFGQNAKAKKPRSFAFGYSCTADGDNAFAVGQSSQAKANDTVAIGGLAIAYTAGCYALGVGAKAGNSTGAGSGNAFAFGANTVASGDYSFGFGVNSKATGFVSEVHGIGNTAAYANQFVIGKNNDNKNNTLFEIGNGANGSNKKNAFEVTTDGQVFATQFTPYGAAASTGDGITADSRGLLITSMDTPVIIACPNNKIKLRSYIGYEYFDVEHEQYKNLIGTKFYKHSIRASSSFAMDDFIVISIDKDPYDLMALVIGPYNPLNVQVQVSYSWQAGIKLAGNLDDSTITGYYLDNSGVMQSKRISGDFTDTVVEL